jgi:hypothetical protein
VSLRRRQPHFANARSVRNALDRIRLRHATRLFGSEQALSREQLCTLEAQDILASRVFASPAPAEGAQAAPPGRSQGVRTAARSTEVSR